MSFFQLGLPNKTLREIRATNTILARLLKQLNSLHEETAFFLQTALTPEKPTETQQVFQDFYFLVAGHNHKFPEIHLHKLKEFASRLDELETTGDVDSALIHLMDSYLVVLGAHDLANSLIYKTIVLSRQGNYWDDVKLLTYGKVCFGVQTLPQRVYEFTAQGVNNTVFSQNQENFVGRVKSSFKALWYTFSRMVAQSAAHLNRNFVLRGSKLRFLKVPLSYIDTEIKEKQEAIQAQLDVHYGQLGLFINSLPVDIQLLAKLLNCQASRSLVLQKIEENIKSVSEYKATRPPGFFARYWPVLLLLVKYGPSTTTSIYQNRVEIVDWIRLNLIDTVVGFWKNWVVKPVWDMLSILRADESMTITSKESLQSDLNSLERMVSDFVKDNGMNVNLEQIHQQVAQGDLTMMMSQYEKEIKTPYKLIIQGLLIRSILIQIQKTKVDGAIAIGGIDKLLKLQQLLFGMLSVLPSLFILYQVNQALHREGISSKSQRIMCLKSLNLVGALVNREGRDDKLIGDGKLFVETINLTLLLRKIIPTKLQEDWLKDLNELMVTSAEDREKAGRAVERIWAMYLPFFRRGI